ncbi:MAG: mechanosensitive ion channel family protein [Candidatus Woesearchaeota archaeon]
MVGDVLQILSTNDYIYAAAVVIVTIILVEALRFLSSKLVHKYWRSRRYSLERQILVRIEHPLLGILLLVGLQLVLLRFIGANITFHTTVKTIYILLVAYIVSRATNIIIEAYGHKTTSRKSQTFHEEVVPLMKSATSILFGLIALIYILTTWGIAIGPLLGGLGIAGAIAGLAFKDTLQNIFGGVALILDDTFRKGDLIQLESGEMGSVNEITLRATHLKTFDDDVLIVPNGQLGEQRIINYAQPTPRLRIVIPVSVAYGSNPDKVKEVLLGVLHGREDVLKYPRREVRFIKMNEYSLDFQLIFFIKDYKEMWRNKNEVTTLCYKALYRHGIEVPFPARTIFKGTPKHYDPDQSSKN